MQADVGVSDWETRPFDVVQPMICETIRRLDEAVGRPPFPNPSTEQCRSLAQSLVHMLRHTQNSGHMIALAEAPEVNMTFPVLCASLKNGSEGQKPCPVLLELLLEALTYVHALSLYPLQTTLKDAREVLPKSPVTFKLFTLTGAMEVDTMRFFLGMSPPAKVEPKERKPLKGNHRAAGRKPNLSLNTHGNPKEGVTAVSSEMLNAALDMVFPPDCTELLLSLFNTPAKFQQVIGTDSELAARVLGVYGDYLLPTLRPLTLLHSLDASLLDVFVDVVQMHGERMTLLTESVFTRVPLLEWGPERLSGLLRCCVDRNVRHEGAFASLVVYVFLYKLLVLWGETQSLPLLTVEEEAKLWVSVLKVVQMLSLNVGAVPTGEVEQVVQPLSVLAEFVRRRYMITELREVASAVPHAAVRPVLEMLAASPAGREKSMPAPPAGSGGGGGNKKKGGRHSSSSGNNNNKDRASASSSRADALDYFSKCIADSFALLFCLTPPSAVEADACTPECIVESLAAQLLQIAECGDGNVPRARTWESYLNLLLSILSPWKDAAHATWMGQRTLSALRSAMAATRRLECCGIIAQRMPDVFAPPRWTPSDYKALLETWLRGVSRVDGFYAPAAPLTPTEYVESVLRLLGDDRRRELVQLLLGAEELAGALIPALQKALTEERADNPAEMVVTTTAAATGRRGFRQLQDELLSTAELRAKAMAEHKQRADEAKKRQLLAEAQRNEAVMVRSKAFEEEQRKLRCMKDEELQCISRLREEREKESEERRVKELQNRLERREKAAAILQEMSAKTKAERLTEQRERLLRYRERVAMDSRISTFLEHLRLTPSRIMHLLATLRPHLQGMTYDDVLEFVVTGNRKVPSDLLAVDEQKNKLCRDGNARAGEATRSEEEKLSYFADEGPTFWDSVMQLVARQSGDKTRDNHVVAGEEEGEGALPSESYGLSFHRSVSAVLDLFDYTMGASETLPEPLPSLNVRGASRVLEKEALTGTGFGNGREALLACQRRGLCVVRDNLCTLTPLGFRYHYPFHDPEQTLGVQLARRRDKARAMMADRQCADVGDDAGEEEEEEDDEDALVTGEAYDEAMTSFAEDNMVCFADEIV
ncbi:uncharacterized protein Tco025E_01373 [Trypanosoma conorhini]|uniref:Uncharacterized protein n=1 Tax=Trypanosoma conorhini TaxID=83891 RepID=A0A3R7PJW1_9TRYP|nr:uncharacterized protein Tco025E_01373 [Trypanosoma conorhini]RNF26410.1 hypothetical protein Tco025E_01373 [Trypanosoma conorhini]